MQETKQEVIKQEIIKQEVTKQEVKQLSPLQDIVENIPNVFSMLKHSNTFEYTDIVL